MSIDRLREQLQRARGWAVTTAVGGAILFLLVFAISGTLVVEKGKMAILIRKSGDDPPNGTVIVKPGQKGIQPDPLPEGWYWRNPLVWDWVVADQIVIEPGHVGVRIRNFGEPLPPGRVIAEEGQKGVVRETLGPGSYVINPVAYTIKTYPRVTIAAGHVGVVTLLSGRDPANPNDFLVQDGERGTQKKTLPPGTYYPNPFIEMITPVDARSHRFDMTGDRIIRFPSLDGFDISMEGTIEWYIDPARVAEVFVKYVDAPDVIKSIVEEVILPNARAFSRIEGSKHLARDFIGGITREKFQEQFLAGLKRSCAAQGIVIQSALVRGTSPPEAITKPIKERELAIRLREMYLQQKERERQQKLLAMEEKIKERKTQLKQAEADVSVQMTKANQEKDVAIIEANRQLELARLQLQAARNQAEATVATGRAKADVILYKNAAEAQGLKNSVAAFGDADTYVRYVLNSKVGPAIAYVLSSTEGPFADIFRRAAEGKAKKK